MRSATVAKVLPLARQQRKTRRPTHTFHVSTRPFNITPFMIAPVLPGETMRNLMMQARVVTDPISNPLVGWWQEYYWFYVKHRDLVGISDELQSMVLDPGWVPDNIDTVSANAWHYFAGAGINWTDYCLQRITEIWFRDEPEAWNSFTDAVTGLPLAQINGNSWLDSLMLKEFVDVPDVDVDLDANSTVMASEVDEAMRQYELARAMGFSDMSYEQFLATYGIPEKPQELHHPELLRYVREWQYPSNTVDPADGTVTSAVSWSVAERADKDRFFKEPGFIFGVTLSRPKVYMGNQSGSAVQNLDSSLSWLPAVLHDDPWTSLKEIPHGSGVITDVGQGQLAGPADDNYVVDVKDLFIYGDQMVIGATPPEVSLPAVDAQRRYATQTDIEGLFSGANYRVRQDGICNLTIAGRLMDTSPRTPSEPSV